MSKQIIKDFLTKYTYPKWNGQTSDELSEMLVEALKQNEVKKKGAVKLGGIDDLFSEALETLEKVKLEKKPLKKVMQVDFYDRVDEDYANLVNK